MTEELKKALESVKTEEEMKAVAEKFKEEISKLSEEELDNIAGGGCNPDLYRNGRSIFRLSRHWCH